MWAPARGPRATVATDRVAAPPALQKRNLVPTCAPSFLVCPMDLRALAAIAEMDKRRILLCPTCEGLLLTAAAGLPLPLCATKRVG